MKNRNFSCVLIFSLFFMTIACGGNRKTALPEDIDLSWAGTWKGKALTINSNIPANELELNIEFTSSRINAFLTDSTQKIIRYPIHDLVLENSTILFKASYDTQRGLRRNVIYRGIKIGPYLKVEFSGSEGGRSFFGKWQAKYFPIPGAKHTTQPSDTTSTTSE